MTQEEIKAFCLVKPGSEETYPFGEWPICYKVAGKIFAQVYPDKLTLKCTAFSGEAFRAAYPGVVTRGYHCPPVQQPYWNTIDLSRFPPEELPMMIDHAYETVVSKLPKKRAWSFWASLIEIPMAQQTISAEPLLWFRCSYLRRSPIDCSIHLNLRW